MATRVNAAASRLEQAREIGAEADAPFEYSFAREQLKRAQSEAADDSDAVKAAETAEVYAQRAIDAVRAARRDGRTEVPR